MKAKFVTGAIPTQTDFANLIDGMLSMPLGGGTGDTTINFGKGDSSDRIFVNAFRYFYGVDESFFLNHIMLEANEVYEKHWFDVGSPHGVIVEFAKTNLSVDKWILIRAKQISLVNNIPEVTIRVPNGTSKADSTYDSQVQQIRESTGRPTNITTFLANYMKTEY